MRNLVIAVSVVGLLGGPLGPVGNAGSDCSILEKLGVVQNVKECEDPVE